MTDILEKLRIDRWAPREEALWRSIAKEAADEIERLRALSPPTEDKASVDIAREAVEKHWHRLQGKRDDAKRHMICEFGTIISNMRRDVRDWQDSSEAYRKDLEALRAPPEPTEADASMLICAVDAAIDAIERGSTSAPIQECLKAARHQFLEARAGIRAMPLQDGTKA